jgi:hypothetical protein
VSARIESNSLLLFFGISILARISAALCWANM